MTLESAMDVKPFKQMVVYIQDRQITKTDFHPTFMKAIVVLSRTRFRLDAFSKHLNFSTRPTYVIYTLENVIIPANIVFHHLRISSFVNMERQ